MLLLGFGCAEEASNQGKATSQVGQTATNAPDTQQGASPPSGHLLKEQWRDDPRIDIARELLRGGRYPEAEIVFTTILNEQPTIARARFLRAIAIQKQQRYAQALEELQAACASGQAFPERLHVDHFRGWCLYHLGRTAKAGEAFAAHVEAFPEEGDSHFGLGVVAIELGNLQDAEPHFDRAIDLQKDIPSRRRELAKAYARLGDVHLGLDRIDAARVSYHTAVIRWPDHHEAWAKLARVLDRLDRGEEAARARNEHRNALRRVGRDVDEEGPG